MSQDKLERNYKFFKEMSQVGDLTKDLIHAVLLDKWPRATVIIAFGLDTQEHYEALYHPIREMQLMPKQLEEAWGNGQKLTELANTAPSNPHKGIEFKTSWDTLLGRGKPIAPPLPIPQKSKDHEHDR